METGWAWMALGALETHVSARLVAPRLASERGQRRVPSRSCWYRGPGGGVTMLGAREPVIIVDQASRGVRSRILAKA
jgi:hypothetical protein